MPVRHRPRVKEHHVDKALEKLAKQLCEYDEASLMALWEKYQTLAEDFQPTRSWEEAVLILGMIQTVRWKNQLFNYHWSESRQPQPESQQPETPKPASSGPPMGDEPKQRGKVLSFRSRQSDESV